MAEVEVCGKKVVLRERFPVGEYFAVIAGWGNMYPIAKVPFAEQVKPLMPVVESWEFAGDPHDLAAWAELDGFQEFLPLWGAISQHLTALYSRQQEAAKN